ncbi:complement factor B-like isoform X1 [Apostichopus japonicus]|uniref:complement factor B-like isoform X1 n=1 Tax=Stichopus japonicus TaxID=307972 RepID=UPI003AB60968
MSGTKAKRWIILVLVAFSCLMQSANSQCTQPEDPPNGEILSRNSDPTHTYRRGYRMRVTCDPSFRMRPESARLTCDGDSWEPTIECVPEDCDLLPPFPRGDIIYRTGESGVVARYACTERGYRLHGETRLTCQSDGTWSADSPVCRAMLICKEVEKRDHLIRQRINGRRRKGLWTYGSRHTFSCEEGYILGSSSTSKDSYYPSIECTISGWNASVPICRVSSDVPRCPPLLEEIEHGRSTAENRTYAPKDIINYYCEEGYRTTSQSWRACALKNIRHTYSAVWLGVTPRCEEITCPTLRGYIENGAAYETSNMVGANATFRCDSGYELIGDSRLTCTRTGRWNGSIPVCDTGENHCPVLGIPLNGYKTGDRYNANDGVEFYCNAGYTLIGSEFRSCRPTGMWSGEPVKCIGNQDFDDIHEMSLKMRENLDWFEASALFEAAVSHETTNTNVHRTARFIPLSHDTGLDLYFMFDGSSSIGEDNFNVGKRFAKELVKEIGVTDRPNSLRVGALVFNSEVEIGFHTVAFDSTDEVLYAIDRIPYRGGGTNIAKAFQILSTVMLPLTSRLNRENSFKTVFLITDGDATEGGDPQKYAKEVRDQGVTIHCIGISENATRRTLSALASEPLREHLFFLKDYSTLEEFNKIITNQTIDYSECGVSPRRISRRDSVEDTRAKLGDWPWQIYIDIYNNICGGTLIEANWILTAASCLHGNVTFVAYAGIVNRFDGQRKKLQVNQTILHPDYDNVTKSHDIALIQLRKPVQLSFHIRKACLPDPAKENRLLTVGAAVVTGWGHNGVVPAKANVPKIPQRDLHELILKLRTRDECEASLVGNDEEDWFDETMTCAGYLGREVGPCSGDSGGPLVKYAKRGTSRRWTVIGVTSWGIGCALQTELDFFANVPHFVPWINENINPEAARLRRNT